MFLCAVKDKEAFFFFPGVFYALTCLAFWVFITCAFASIFWLILPWWRKKSCLSGTSKALKSSNASCFQNSPLSSGFLTSFGKAGNWLVSIAAADCHPLDLKVKVLPWCGGRSLLGRWKIPQQRQKIKWSVSDAVWEQGHPDPTWGPPKPLETMFSDLEFKPQGKGATMTKTVLNSQVSTGKEDQRPSSYSSPSSLPRHWSAT